MIRNPNSDLDRNRASSSGWYRQGVIKKWLRRLPIWRYHGSNSLPKATLAEPYHQLFDSLYNSFSTQLKIKWRYILLHIPSQNALFSVSEPSLHIDKKTKKLSRNPPYLPPNFQLLLVRYRSEPTQSIFRLDLGGIFRRSIRNISISTWLSEPDAPEYFSKSANAYHVPMMKSDTRTLSAPCRKHHKIRIKQDSVHGCICPLRVTISRISISPRGLNLAEGLRTRPNQSLHIIKQDLQTASKRQKSKLAFFLCQDISMAIISIIPILLIKPSPYSPLFNP